MIIDYEGNKIQSGFDSVACWHSVAGFEPKKSPQLPDDLSCTLIKEELTELFHAIHEKDLVATAEELGDLLVVVNRMAYDMGLDGDTLLIRTMQSNWTKFCNTEDEAQETVGVYNEEHGEGYSDYKLIEGDPNLWVAFRVSDGKILKSVDYVPKDFSAINGGTSDEPDTP